MDEPEIYKVSEVAKRLRIHLNTVRSMINRGDLRGVKAGRSWRVTKKEVDKFLNNRKEEPEGKTE